MKNRTEKLRKAQELSSLKHKGAGDIEEIEDIEVLKLLFNKLKKRYNLTSTDVINLTQEEIIIPISAYNDILSPLETDVKYLKENLNFDYVNIAKLLARNRKTIWQAYKNAVRKMPERLKVSDTEYNIPVSVLRYELSILEATVAYLKDEFDINYHEIGELLKRNEKTVWTVYNRAQNKNQNQKL